MSPTMMKGEKILGIGNDIVEIERIRKTIDAHGDRLLNRLFTVKEQDYCLKHKDPMPYFAGRFSAKEAIVKAIGVGFGKDVSWKDMEILNNEQGKPYVLFSENLKMQLDDSSILISISHCQLYATAVAIWIK